jgi:DNA-binding SARP family transcriptional activator/tetratricopeptide (TPR) repeat protein
LSGLDVLVLGQFEVSVAGRAVRLTTGRLRTLLAVLALAAGRTVSVERLTAAMWGDEPPDNPRRTLQTYAARLRAELGYGVVSSRSSGFALDVGVDAVDALRFEQLLDDASHHDEPGRERQLLAEALGLWRGEPFEDVASSGWLGEIEAPRLVERRLAALERQIDLDLDAGRHGELVSELNEWAVRYPLRESLWVRLLVVLDRCGRRADALARYEQIRAHIADELGVDPSSELQQVFADLLADRPLATGSAPASAANQAVPAAVPQQLPAPPPSFVGRTAELSQLDDNVDSSAMVITTIDGMAGVGKTALAVHAAHRLAGHYPDGQLFLDLHGFTEGVAPVDPSEALDRMLRSLGVPGDQIPPHLDDRAALFRSRLADRRVLILLDNAATEAQVAPLLPGSPGCLVLVTSRHRLAGLDQTRSVSLDVLPPADAVNMFTGTVGAERVFGESPDTLAEIVELCGRLPLALRIAAARLRAHRSWNPRHLIDRLADRQHRLVQLKAGQRNVIATLDLSYQQLTPTQQRAYRLIGLHPGPDVDLYGTAALLDGDLPGTRRVLDQLLDTHLLQEPTPDRYQFHDLARQHAALMATRDESEPARHSALTRLFTHYSQTTAAAMDTVYPFERERHTRPSGASNPVSNVRSADVATVWLDTELPNLLAAARYATDHGWHDYPPQLATTLDRHLRSRGRTSDAETLHQLALHAAEAAGNAAAEINSLVRLGLLHGLAGQYSQAEPCYRRALRLALEHAEPRGELDALHGLGQMQRMQCQFIEAERSFKHALNIADTIDYPTGELESLLGLGHTYLWSDQHELAGRYFGQGFARARTAGHRPCQLDALVGLGWNHLAEDDHEQAADCFGQALDIARAGEQRIGELTSLIGLAATQRKQRHHLSAAGLYEDVLARARQICKPNWTFEALQGLGRTRLSLNRPADALACHRKALDIANEIAQPSDVARAHDGLAHAHHARHEHDQARHHWQQALDILTDLGIDSTEDWEANPSAIRAHLTAYDEAQSEREGKVAAERLRIVKPGHADRGRRVRSAV